jgi:hypothetical protein
MGLRTVRCVHRPSKDRTVSLLSERKTVSYGRSRSIKYEAQIRGSVKPKRKPRERIGCLEDNHGQTGLRNAEPVRRSLREDHAISYDAAIWWHVVHR